MQNLKEKWHEEFSTFSPEHVRKTKNWDFDGVLLSKVENVWAQNLHENFVSWQWRMMQNLKRNWLVEYDEFWPEHSKISKICTLMDCFWPKYIMFELKKYREVMFDGTEYWCKTWRKNDLCFQKSHEEFSLFSPEHVRKTKNWDELKLYREVLCHDNEEWSKNWRGIDLSVQNWHEEFDEFWPEHSKISKTCTLMGFFWTKYIMFELKKV